MDHKHFDAMHNAVDGLDSSVIFPSIVSHRVVYNTKASNIIFVLRTS